MASSVWSIFTDGKDEYDYLYYFAEFLGRWEESIEAITSDFSKTGWSHYTTFTKSDFDQDPELYEAHPIAYNKLPENRQLFDCEAGIRRFTALKQSVIENKAIFEEDYEFVKGDIEKAISLLQKAKEDNRKWYLHMEVDY